MIAAIKTKILYWFGNLWYGGISKWRRNERNIQAIRLTANTLELLWRLLLNLVCPTQCTRECNLYYVTQICTGCWLERELIQNQTALSNACKTTNLSEWFYYLEWLSNLLCTNIFSVGSPGRRQPVKAHTSWVQHHYWRIWKRWKIAMPHESLVHRYSVQIWMPHRHVLSSGPHSGKCMGLSYLEQWLLTTHVWFIYFQLKTFSPD